MIATAATTIVQKAENSERMMSENLKRSLPNSSTEFNSEKSCKIIRHEIHWMKKIIQLLDSIKDSADNKAVIERLKFIENSDLKCTCHPRTVNVVSQNDGEH